MHGFGPASKDPQARDQHHPAPTIKHAMEVAELAIDSIHIPNKQDRLSQQCAAVG